MMTSLVTLTGICVEQEWFFQSSFFQDLVLSQRWVSDNNSAGPLSTNQYWGSGLCTYVTYVHAKKRVTEIWSPVPKRHRQKHHAEKNSPPKSKYVEYNGIQFSFKRCFKVSQKMAKQVQTGLLWGTAESSWKLCRSLALSFGNVPLVFDFFCIFLLLISTSFCLLLIYSILISPLIGSAHSFCFALLRTIVCLMTRFAFETCPCFSLLTFPDCFPDPLGSLLFPFCPGKRQKRATKHMQTGNGTSQNAKSRRQAPKKATKQVQPKSVLQQINKTSIRMAVKHNSPLRC